MDPWGQVTSAFLSSFENARDKKFKKKLMEEELRQKMELMTHESQLQNQALTPEQKLMQVYKQDPKFFTGFQSSKDPYKPQELQLATDKFKFDQDLESGKLDLMRANQDADNAYKKWQMKNKAPDLTPEIRNYQFLSSQQSIPPEKALQMVFQKNSASGLQPTMQERNFDWIKKQFPQMTDDQILQILFKPDMMSQFMQMMGGASSNTNNQDSSQGWGK